VINPTIHVPPQPGTVRFRISTSSGTDTLFFGVPGTIYFNVDAMGNEIAGMTFGFKWTFSNGNIVGPFSDVTGEVQYSPTALEVYESTAFNPLFAQGTDPDTSLLVLTDFGGERFSGSTWIWSVTFQPTDTGTVFLDSNVLLPPVAENISAWGFAGAPLPSNFIPGRIVVLPCPYALIGDVNQDAVLTSADLLHQLCFQERARSAAGSLGRRCQLLGWPWRVGHHLSGELHLQERRRAVRLHREAHLIAGRTQRERAFEALAPLFRCSAANAS
jgi:hypothetical protein